MNRYSLFTAVVLLGGSNLSADFDVSGMNLTSSTHESGVLNSSSSATFNWTPPSTSNGTTLDGYYYKLDTNSSNFASVDDGSRKTIGSTTTLTVDLTSDGDYYLHLAPKDSGGNSGATVRFPIKVDVTKPTTSITSSVDSSTATTVTITASDTNGIDKIYYTTNGDDVNSSSNQYSQPFNIYASQTIKYRAVDKAGNWSDTASEAITADYRGNVVSFETIDSNISTSTSSTSPKRSINLTATDLSSYKYQIDSSSESSWQSATDNNGTVDISELTDGSHTLKAWGRDSSNNTQQSATSITFNIDNTGPTQLSATVNGVDLSTQSSFSSSQMVTLTTESNGTIKYSTDGTDPSQIYSEPFQLTADTTIKATATDYLGNSGETKSFTFSIDIEAPTSITVTDSSSNSLDSNNSSHYNSSYIYSSSETFSITGVDSESQTLKFYSAVDTTPVVQGDGSSSVTVSESGTLNIIAVDEVGNQKSGSYQIAIDQIAPTNPSISFDSSECTESGSSFICNTQTPTLTFSSTETTTPDSVKYYYTVDDSTPTKSSTEHNSSSKLSLSTVGSTTVKFIAVDMVGNQSSESSKSVSYDSTAIGSSLSIAEGEYINALQNSITVTVQNGSSYWYSIDSATAVYESNSSQPIDISGLTDGLHTLSVTGSSTDQNQSSATVRNFMVDNTSPTDINASYGDSLYFKTQTSLTMTSSSDATIYYTTDGSTPDSNSTAYTTSITVSSSTDIKAVAIDRAKNSSEVLTLQFVEDSIAPNSPTISGSTSFSDSTTVTISGESGSTIYYTIDGSTPTVNSTLYTAPLTFGGTTTVKAIVVDPAGNISGVTSKTFTRYTATVTTPPSPTVPTTDDTTTDTPTEETPADPEAPTDETPTNPVDTPTTDPEVPTDETPTDPVDTPTTDPEVPTDETPTDPVDEKLVETVIEAGDKEITLNLPETATAPIQTSDGTLYELDSFDNGAFQQLEVKDDGTINSSMELGSQVTDIAISTGGTVEVRSSGETAITTTATTSNSGKSSQAEVVTDSSGAVEVSISVDGETITLPTVNSYENRPLKVEVKTEDDGSTTVEMEAYIEDELLF